VKIRIEPLRNRILNLLVSLQIILQAFLLLPCMKRIILVFLSYLILSCNNEASFKKAENAQDAGREFIRASLNGDFERARSYLLKDSFNVFFYNKWEKEVYGKLTEEEKRSYRESSILPVRIENTNDSTVDYAFTNSYKRKDTTVIKIIRVNGEWLVDLKDIR
jgi:hypothetical protein